MLIIDTNVISEIMKTFPSLQVIRWFDKQKVSQLFITTITIAEIEYGINVLPKGKKRHLLEMAFKSMVEEGFKHRTLSFDIAAASCYGNIMANRKKLGRPLGVLDGQIAAIAVSQKATMVSRNVRDFSNCGLTLVNPFENDL